MKLLRHPVVILPVLLLQCVLGWFVYTRFLLPVYRMDGELLTYKGVN